MSQPNADHLERAASGHGESRTFQMLAEDDGDAAATSGSTRGVDDGVASWCGESQTDVVAAGVPGLGKSKHIETFIDNCFVHHASLVT